MNLFPGLHNLFIFIMLLKNTPLVKYIGNYIWDLRGVFSISSLVRILMTSFLAFSRLFV